MKLLNVYGKDVLAHPLFIQNKSKIEKLGIDTFLQMNGVFVEVIPLVTLPPHKIIHIHFEIRYWSNLKNEMEWNMGYYESPVQEKEDGIVDAAILKAFELVGLKSKRIF